jgi:hypothetical protein
LPLGSKEIALNRKARFSRAVCVLLTAFGAVLASATSVASQDSFSYDIRKNSDPRKILYSIGVLPDQVLIKGFDKSSGCQNKGLAISRAGAELARYQYTVPQTGERHDVLGGYTIKGSDHQLVLTYDITSSTGDLYREVFTYVMRIDKNACRVTRATLTSSKVGEEAQQYSFADTVNCVVLPLSSFEVPKVGGGQC